MSRIFYDRVHQPATESEIFDASVVVCECASNGRFRATIRILRNHGQPSFCRRQS